ncbi:hypothetical protein KGM_200167 [Danaus plexippus plexippus]|uniref:Tetraspanin n=1 Tax=Danaus plexippus plexippus TaxID=278856 RepID=A0A212F0D6_DANPL|nr:hypothetical protein KGM_200167 [Danaus plexippus plexippus]
MFKMRVPKLLKSVRYSLAAVNSVFLLTGVLLLILGVATLLTFNNYSLLVTYTFFTLSNFVIATGVIILFVAALGYYGAVSEQFLFIVGYVVLLFVILVFEIAITTLGFNLQNDASRIIRRPMTQTLQLYGNRSEINITWDNLQSGFQCCGVVSISDWPTGRLPVSCCHIDYGTISPFECTSSKAYTVGCAAALGEYLSYHAYVIGVTGAFVICLQLLVLAAGCWLAYRSRFEEVELES